jgi:hypothetical protein
MLARRHRLAAFRGVGLPCDAINNHEDMFAHLEAFTCGRSWQHRVTHRETNLAAWRTAGPLRDTSACDNRTCSDVQGLSQIY